MRIKQLFIGLLIAVLFYVVTAGKTKNKKQKTSKFLSQSETQSLLKIPLSRIPSEQVQSPKELIMMQSNIKTRKTVFSENGQLMAEVELQNNQNYDYIGSLSIGNPPQKIRALFDTGSSYAWILSSLCNTTRCQPGTKNYYYSPELSSTYVSTDWKSSIRFGIGGLEGVFGYDELRFGEGEEAIEIKDQLVGLIKYENVLTSNCDAIFGLAYPTMAARGLPFFDSMIQQGLLEKNMFAFYMTMTDKDHSELVFGGYDESKFFGGIHWHTVTDQYLWSLRLDDIKYNGVSMNICQGKENCMVAVDSGTSLLTAPSWADDIILNNIPLVENCENKFGFGTLTYVIDGIEYNLPSHHFIERYTNVFTEGDSVCMPVVARLDLPKPGLENLFIVGDVFMQIYYSIFDRDNNKVGFAFAKEPKREKVRSNYNYYKIHKNFKEKPEVQLTKQ